MIERLKLILASSIAVAIAGACAPAGRVAEHCVAVSAIREEGFELATIADTFAEAEGMSVLSGTGTRVYRSRDGTIEVSLLTHLGSIGATFGVYSTEETIDPDFLRNFDEFLASEVATRWPVQDCANVPGMEPPVRHGSIPLCGRGGLFGKHFRNPSFTAP